MTIGFKPLIFNEKTAPRRRHLYEGKTKTLFDGPEPGTFVLYFKDVCHLQDKVIVTGKGVINNRLSEMFMSRLSEIGIQTHFLRRLNMREQLVRATEVLPFHVVVHNLAIGHFASRLGLEEAMLLPEPIPEFHVKNKKGKDSVVSERHLLTLGWADEEEIKSISEIVQRVNDFLCGQFLALGLRLMRYSLEFGRVYLSDYMGDTQILLVDEISLDNCYILDIKTGKRLDVHCLPANDLIGFNQTVLYQDLAKRFGLLTEGGPADLSIKPAGL